MKNDEFAGSAAHRKRPKGRGRAQRVQREITVRIIYFCGNLKVLGGVWGRLFTPSSAITAEESKTATIKITRAKKSSQSIHFSTASRNWPKRVEPHCRDNTTVRQQKNRPASRTVFLLIVPPAHTSWQRGGAFPIAWCCPRQLGVMRIDHATFQKEHRCQCRKQPPCGLTGRRHRSSPKRPAPSRRGCRR